MTVFETEIEDEKDLLARIYHVKWMAVQYKLLFPGIRILEKFNGGGGEGGEVSWYYSKKNYDYLILFTT